MPVYDVNYVCDLASEQKDEIAKAITHLHTRQFHAPSLFVNVHFQDSVNDVRYAGGARVSRGEAIPCLLVLTSMCTSQSPVAH